MYELSNAAGEYILSKLAAYNDLSFLSSATEASKFLDGVNIDNLIEQVNEKPITGAERLSIIKSRIGHEFFKRMLLQEQDRCQVCGIDLKVILVASHIKPWSRSTPDEKVDPNNGLLLCPNHDRLFDSGLITFSNVGDIVVSSTLPQDVKEKLGLKYSLRIRMNETRKKYLEWHMKYIYMG